MNEIVAKVLQASGFDSLNPAQQAALDKGLLEGESLIVAAPTASGKTLLAEIAALDTIMNKGKKVVYIVPLKALATEKYEEFKSKYDPLGLRIAISIGDLDSTDPWLADYDLVIVSDFGHGFLTDNLINLICKHSKFLAVNTQTNSANMGFNLITEYTNIDYVALDELEIRYAAHNRTGELRSIMKIIAPKIHCKNLAITRGIHGAVSFCKELGFLSSPALATQVVDTIGAGDAFLSFTAPLAALEAPMDMVLFIGNAAGALAVQIVCNRESVSPVELKKFIATVFK